MTICHGRGDYALPEAMSAHEISMAVNGFATAAAAARDAGFDGVEIHGANGYLLDQFLTEGVNLRTDRYGGDIDRRLRLIIEVVEAVRSAIGPKLVLGVRISPAKVNDARHIWSGGETRPDEHARQHA